MKLWLVVSAIVVSLCLTAVPTEAYQRAFYGGSFTQAAGIYASQVGVWDDNSNGWQRITTPNVFEAIWDVSPVGDNGIFAAGSIITVNDKPSFGVAFFDGTKWCPIAQGLATNDELNNANAGPPGQGWAVWCNSATSCYVAGQFSFIENLPSNAPNQVINFAHYIRNDTSSSDWVFDTSIVEWNGPDVPSQAFLPDNAIPGTLVGVPEDEPEYFFVATSTGSGTPPVGVGTGDISNIYRGSKADGGWIPFLDPSLVFPGATLSGFYVDSKSSSPAVYAVSTSGSTDTMAKKTTVVTRPAPCATPTCIPVTESTEWASLLPGFTEGVASLANVVAVNSTTRYYIGHYTPGSGFSPRYVVLRQDGFAAPVPVGAPFSRGTSQELFRIGLYNNDEPVVTGDFTTANLAFPDNTDDVDGVDQIDIRELDSVNHIAVFTDGKWTSHFGGGISFAASGSGFGLLTVLKHNKQSNKWIVANPLLSFVYNKKAEGLAFFDDDEDLNADNIFPLFTRKLYYRDEPAGESLAGAVYDVACEEGNCKYVYAAGQFNYHGPDLLGSIAKVEVRRDEPVVLAVGGGLWFTDDNIVPTDPNLQFTAGQVYTVKSRDGWAYAGGVFSRGKNGYACLNNLARIRHSETESGSWEDLGGGCDNPESDGAVFDMQFWGDDLYVAGAFLNCGGKQVNFVAAYNNGQFRSLNNGLDGTAYSLEYFQERIIVGGIFDHAGGLPTGGVAAWDGRSWRALQSACTDDCISGDLKAYFTVPQRVGAAVSLHAAKDGTVLYARVVVEGADPDSTGLALGQWKYFGKSDNGQWTIKGELLSFFSVPLTPDPLFIVPNGDTIMNNGTQLVVAGVPANSLEFFSSGLGVHGYSLSEENWVDNNVLISSNVFVVRSSASTLHSFLSFLF